MTPCNGRREEIGPLAGVKVLELGSSVAGPAAGRLLADLGADVFKVEPPEGDQLRTWGAQAPDGTSYWFKTHNRNKRLLCFDLSNPADAAIVRKIALQCDVVLENFRAGRLAAWGLGYDDLTKGRPDLIYASISGFGQTGPYAKRAGFGNVAESMGGLRYITGYADQPPVRVGISLGDELAGMYAVIGILAALRARDRDGVGDYIDVALTESAISLLEGTIVEYAQLGIVAERSGNRHKRAAPSSVYPTRDAKWIAIGGNGQSIFKRLCAVIGQPSLFEDARFAGNPKRVANAEALDEVIGNWTSSLNLAEIVKRLADAGVPAGPVMSVKDIFEDPHFRERGAITTISTDTGDELAVAGLVPRLRNHPGQLRRAAGSIGRDQEEALETFDLLEKEKAQ
jgi:crotonobetainyl-CoA:carnitine CoA-transferase CaiB-like acyl-CoA transferase